MTSTTRIVSVSVPVTDQDAALKFYTEVLGCELKLDVEAWPGARWVEVVPPGSNVSIALLKADGEIPIAIRMGTDDAAEAHASLEGLGVRLDNPEVLRWENFPPMFAFADPDGNGLVYLEDSAG